MWKRVLDVLLTISVAILAILTFYGIWSLTDMYYDDLNDPVPVQGRHYWHALVSACLLHRAEFHATVNLAKEAFETYKYFLPSVIFGILVSKFWLLICTIDLLKTQTQWKSEVGYIQ